MTAQHITFPPFAGTRCLMMPYRQGDPDSVPQTFSAYREVIERVYLERDAVGFLTIDETVVPAGGIQRGSRATAARALHTEAGRDGTIYTWGDPPFRWGDSPDVTLDADVQILIANNICGSCAVWDSECSLADMTRDGDLGHLLDQYPYSTATLLAAGEVRQLGIRTPHEGLPIRTTQPRQFLRIVGQGVHGRTPYFTRNPLMPRLP